MVCVTGLRAKMQGSFLDGNGIVIWGRPSLTSIVTSLMEAVANSLGFGSSKSPPPLVVEVGVDEQNRT